MSEPCVFTNDLVVQTLDCNFSDEKVCVAARTSTAGMIADSKATAGLINSLMRNRHGSPFEHMSVTWRVKGPLFMWREHHRHRIASYNEESARYKVLAPEFYIPSPERHLQQIGKPMEYKTIPGNDQMYRTLKDTMEEASEESYLRYEQLLSQGVMREVARMVLPVNIMSTCIVTMNARGLMNFLSLRVNSEDSTYPSKPMREIQMVAEKYEETFKFFAPITHAAFVSGGRVAP